MSCCNAALYLLPRRDTHVHLRDLDLHLNLDLHLDLNLDLNLELNLNLDLNLDLDLNLNVELNLLSSKIIKFRREFG